MNQIENDYQRLHIMEDIAFGTITKVVSRQSGKICILKEVGLTKMGPKQRQGALNEVFLLKTMDHTNIIQFVDSFFHESKSIHQCLYQFLLQSGGCQLITKKNLP